MQERVAEQFLEFARGVALHAYACAAEAGLFDEFEYLDECSNHLWSAEGQPLLATVWYALAPGLRETAAMREAAASVMLLFLETFDAGPAYGPEHLDEAYLSTFSVGTGDDVITGPTVYNPMFARRAEDESPFG